MYLMYVDESGDPGVLASPTRYFVLSGLALHESAWQKSLDQLVAFRHRMKVGYGLNMRSEIHAAPLLNKPGEAARIPKHDRLAIIRNFADELASIEGVLLLNVVVDKQDKSSTENVFELAWHTLLLRFEKALEAFAATKGDGAVDCGMILADKTDGKTLTGLLRKLQHSHLGGTETDHPELRSSAATSRIIEDPVFRDSSHSLFIQGADLAAFLLYQYVQPNQYMRKKAASRYFLRLAPILGDIAPGGDLLETVSI